MCRFRVTRIVKETKFYTTSTSARTVNLLAGLVMYSGRVWNL